MHTILIVVGAALSGGAWLLDERGPGGAARSAWLGLGLVLLVAGAASRILSRLRDGDGDRGSWDERALAAEGVVAAARAAMARPAPTPPAVTRTPAPPAAATRSAADVDQAPAASNRRRTARSLPLGPPPQ